MIVIDLCVLRSTVSTVSAWLYLPFVLIVFSVFYLMLLWLITRVADPSPEGSTAWRRERERERERLWL